MEARAQARALVRKMSLDEKIAQLHAVWFTMDNSGNLTVKQLKGFQQSETVGDPFEHLKNGIGQITRPLGSQPIAPRQGVRTLNRIQHYLVTKTRLGIPALPHEECLSGLMAQGGTIFPAGINNGATWNPELVQRAAAAIGAEVYSVGSRQGLAPVLDVCRDARWGRSEETFGEDPYLVASLACGYVRGLQDPEHPVLATLKHFAGHSFSEGGRNHAPVRIGRRELNDIFLYPFEAAIKTAKAGSVMPAYHDIDGEPLHQSRHYVQELLREKWGFDGLIVSDYEGLDQLRLDHRTQADPAHAAAAGLKAGIDVELPGSTLYGQGIKDAVERGLLSIDEVDEAVTRHLIQKISLGLFKNPYSDEAAILDNREAHCEIAREVAEESLVLIENNGVLPLSGQEKLALIGPLADAPMAMMGGYAFPIHLISSESTSDGDGVPTLLKSMTRIYKDRIVYAEGCSILTGRPDTPAVFPGDINQDGSSQADYISRDTSRIAQAVRTAEQSDVIVLAVGDLAGLFLSGTVGEGSDVSSLRLPGVQQELIDAVLALNKPTVLLVFSGRPYHLGTAFGTASAIMQAWLPGQEGAAAVTDALLGKVNPGGKLPVSIPRHAGAMPYYYNHKLKSAGTPIQKDFGADYSFGHGVSYTSFRILSSELLQESCPVDGAIRLSVKLENTGPHAGSEVIQLYFRDLYASVVRPVQELKAFKRVYMEAGQGVELQFAIPTDVLSFTTEDTTRVVEAGEFEILVGTSSRDIHFRHRVFLTGETRELPQEWNMLSHCEVRPL